MYRYVRIEISKTLGYFRGAPDAEDYGMLGVYIGISLYWEVTISAYTYILGPLRGAQKDM